jgi:uncharacterized membrane protein
MGSSTSVLVESRRRRRWRGLWLRSAVVCLARLLTLPCTFVAIPTNTNIRDVVGEMTQLAREELLRRHLC